MSGNYSKVAGNMANYDPKDPPPSPGASALRELAELEPSAAKLVGDVEAAERAALKSGLAQLRAQGGTGSDTEHFSVLSHATYCRDALRLLLQTCPSISGVTIRTHGESGVEEGSYQFWQTVFEGVATCGRRVEIDLHPKGLDETMMRNALATRQPVTVSPKFWAEHMLIFYDLREDHTIGIFSPKGDGSYQETRDPRGDLAPFGSFIEDASPTGLLRRHTIDVRAARADTSSPIGPVTFTPSQRVSQYIYGSRPGSNVVEQLQINPPNLPMFALGTIPFIGDYIDVNAETFTPTANGWAFNTSPSSPTVFHGGILETLRAQSSLSGETF